MKQIIIINGPNLNLQGRRCPEIYGTDTFDTLVENMRGRYPHIDITLLQSNHEGDIIDWLHAYGLHPDTIGIILNAGAYTHTSLAIADAVEAISAPVIEVHISNVHKREEFRHHSFISCACLGVICGFGMDSYRLAVEALKMKNAECS